MKFSNVLIHFNYSITKKSLAALSLQNASSRSSHEIETVRVYLFNSMYKISNSKSFAMFLNTNKKIGKNGNNGVA